MFALVEGPQHHLGSGFDGAGHLHEDIDGVTIREDGGIIRQYGESLSDSNVCLLWRTRELPFGGARFPEGPFGVLRRPVGNAHEPNTGRGSAQLESDRAA